MFNEANEPSSACRLWRIFQVETSTPPATATAWLTMKRRSSCVVCRTLNSSANGWLQSGGRRGYSRRPPTPPDVRFRIRRFRRIPLYVCSRTDSEHLVYLSGCWPLPSTEALLRGFCPIRSRHFNSRFSTGSALRRIAPTTMASADFSDFIVPVSRPG
jgi:hypothetical protein